MNQFVWRKMRADDVPAVTETGNSVHPDFPEDQSVFQDRFDLYPAGCFVLEHENKIVGYGISHPWTLDEAPALNSLLQVLPDNATSYYVHDVALTEVARSGGNAAKLVALMVQQAKDDGFDRMALVAVNGSRPFWERQEFGLREVATLDDKLKSYSDDACYMVRILHSH